jgi:glucokinase
MKKYAFGVDVGGTTCKIGFFETDGKLIDKWEIKTNKENGGASILSDVAQAIEGKLTEKGISRDDVQGIGVGVPGPVKNDGVVHRCVNVGWGVVNVEKELGDLTGLKVKAGNDANVAALGEMWQGAAKGCRDVIMVTLGTGVGGGIIVDGKVVAGFDGAGGEIGHITVNAHEKEQCNCGQYGCLEQYSSATGVVRCMKKLLDENPEVECVLRGTDFAAKDVFDAARNGDALASREVEDMSNTLGMALASIASTTDPEMFLVGGGVARAGDVLFDPLVKHFKEYAFRSCRETPIKAASLGNDAGIYGAVRLIVGE